MVFETGTWLDPRDATLPRRLVRQHLGVKNYIIYTELNKQKFALIHDKNAKTNELKQWLLKNSGEKSMIRKGLGYLREGKTLASDLLSLMTYNRYKYGPIPDERFPIGLEKPDEMKGKDLIGN